MQKYAVIVAGGSGSRMGGGIPKQFRTISSRPVVWWSMKAFHDEDPETRLILVLPKDFISLWRDFFSTLPEEDRFPHETVAGGNSRTESVRNGLDLVDIEESMVAVHDGARPLVSPSTISKGWEAAQKLKAAIPVVPVIDSLRKIESRKKIDSPDSKEDLRLLRSVSVDRSDYVAVQTPQVFLSRLLKEAYAAAHEKNFTDDASVVESYGHPVALFEGDPENIKITNPKDMAIAAILMGENA